MMRVLLSVNADGNAIWFKSRNMACIIHNTRRRILKPRSRTTEGRCLKTWRIVKETFPQLSIATERQANPRGRRQSGRDKLPSSRRDGKEKRGTPERVKGVILLAHGR